MKLAAHIIPSGFWNGMDTEQLRRIKPKSIKTVYPDKGWLNEIAYPASPKALFILRNPQISEDHGGLHEDPVGKAHQHAYIWKKWLYDNKLSIPSDQIVVCGLNEPFVRSPIEVESTVSYNYILMEDLGKSGIRAGGPNISVGHPLVIAPDTVPNWTPFEPLVDLINEYNHFLVIHEYTKVHGPQVTPDGLPSMTGGDWGWYAGRYLQCPFDVPIIIGEYGIEYLMEDPSADYSRRGWRGHGLSDAQYLAQLLAYEQEVQKDPRVHSVSVFTWWGNPVHWSSFFVNELVRLLPENTEFDNMMSVGLDQFESRLISAGQEHQVIQYNPDAALQRRMVDDGYMPNSGEFEMLFNGVTYVAQRAEKLDKMDARVYFVEKGDWDNVGYVNVFQA